MRLSPYLQFDGNCREAFTFYHECLGGQLDLQLLGESPLAAGMPEALHDQILHAHLVAGEISIMASDMSTPEQLIRSGIVTLSINSTDLEATRAAFAKLSDGADVTNPLQEEYFGTYGALTDKFGMSWMFQVDPA